MDKRTCPCEEFFPYPCDDFTCPYYNVHTGKCNLPEGEFREE